MSIRRVALRNISNKMSEDMKEEGKAAIKKLNSSDKNEESSNSKKVLKNKETIESRKSSNTLKSFDTKESSKSGASPEIKEKKKSFRLSITKRKSLSHSTKKHSKKQKKSPLKETTNKIKKVLPLNLKDISSHKKVFEPACFILTKEESSILKFLDLDQKNDIRMEFLYRNEYVESFKREHTEFEEYLKEIIKEKHKEEYSDENQNDVSKENHENEKNNDLKNSGNIESSLSSNESSKRSNSKDLYMRKEAILEHNTTKFININYIMHQHDLNWTHRSILIDWLIDISYNLSLLPETLYLTINLIDRFLSLRLVTKSKLQLVGLTALFISAKYEEVECPSIFTFTEMINITTEELIKAEKYFLLTLRFNIEFKQPLDIIRILSSTNLYDLKVRVLSKYLLELTLLKEKFLKYSSIIKALSSFYLSKKIINDRKCLNLPFYMLKIEKGNIKECVNDLLWILKENKDKKIFQSIKKKYSSKSHLNVSHFVDEFVSKHLCK